MVNLDDINAYSRPENTLSKGTSHLYSYINRATAPSNQEPNLALNLEIADLINSKKGNMPRDAAVALVHKINSLNPITSLLAIALLDMLVKNCGYPFHLQIATKEFLNELVRRFPERPPARPSRVQFRILELLEQWRQTLCTTSRYKEDMGYVRDMHRLLHYKGYDFPAINAGAASVLNPSDSLKSASEMEEEDRIAHSAKLQELIRRGTPADLAEANQLMKVMAGFDQNKTDYRKKAAEEVDQIRRKAALLLEMLSGVSADDVLTEGDIYAELADSIRNAQPKLQKMCEDESDDQAAVARLFELNDSINSIVGKYDHLKRGDFAAAQRLRTTIPDAPVVDSSTGAANEASTQTKFAQDLDLLDFDPSESTHADLTASQNTTGTSTKPSKQGTSDLDDLLGLNFGGVESYGSNIGSITLGQASNPSKQQASPLAAFDHLNLGGAAPSQAQQKQISVLGSPSLNINLDVQLPSKSATSLKATAKFSNKSSTEVLSDIDLQLAVPKTMQLQIDSPSSRTLRPGAADNATQTMTISLGSRSPQSTTMKLRYKVIFKANGAEKTEQGQIAFDI